MENEIKTSNESLNNNIKKQLKEAKILQFIIKLKQGIGYTLIIVCGISMILVTSLILRIIWNPLGSIFWGVFTIYFLLNLYIQYKINQKKKKIKETIDSLVKNIEMENNEK